MKSFKNRLKSAWLAIPMTCLMAAALPMTAMAAEPVLDETEIGLEGSLVLTNTAELNVYVNGAWSAELSNKYVYGDTVKAEVPETVSGKKFSYWEAEGSVLSYDREFEFTITANTRLDAVYGKTSLKTSTAGFTSIIKDDNGNIVFNAYSEADNATERGIYYSKTASTKDSLISKGTKEQGTADNKCCTLTITPESEKTYYYAMPYVKNSSSTYYGAVKKVSFEDLDFGTSAILDLGDGMDTQLPEDIKEEIDIPGVTDVLGTAEAPTVDSDGVVHWSAVENAVSYKIIKEYNNSTFEGKKTTNLSYKQNNVPVVEYKIWIRAFDENDNYTDGEVLTVAEKKVLGKAKAPTVDSDGVVHWLPVKNAVNYKIVKEYNNSTFEGKKTNNLSYKQNNVPVVEYKIWIRAFDANDNYTDGEVLTVAEKKPLGKAKAPTVDKDGTVHWTAVKNAVNYKIMKEYNNKTFEGKETNNLSYKQNNVPVVEYKIWIRAFDADENFTDGEVLTVPAKAQR